MANNYLSTKVIQSLIDESIGYALKKEEYEVKEIPSIQLLTKDRFDVALKLAFLCLKEKNSRLAKEIYKDHIAAFSTGTFSEPNNDQKNTIQDYYISFEEVLKQIKEHGFDPNTSIIPTSLDGQILNGAHRLSAAIYCNKKVATIKTEQVLKSYNFQFFKDRGLESWQLDFGARVLINNLLNSYIAIVWPTAKGKNDEISKLLKDVYYFKEISLTEEGASNLIRIVYRGEKWLGDEQDEYPGAISKMVECFKNKGKVRAFLFTSESLDNVINIKDKIRSLFSVGKHSIHITDSHKETIEVGQTIFNDNSLHHLNYSRPYRYQSFIYQNEYISNQLAVNQVSADELIIDSSSTLAAYGLRESRDIDYLSLEIDIENGKMENHNNSAHYYQIPIEDLIHDPRNHFFFRGIKYINPGNLKRFKINRGEQKDNMDLELLNKIEDSSNAISLTTIKVRLYFSFLKIKVRGIKSLIIVLKKIGLYKGVRKLYHRFK